MSRLDKHNAENAQISEDASVPSSSSASKNAATRPSKQAGDNISEGPEMLYVRLADADATSNESLIEAGSQVIYLGEPFGLTFVVKRACGSLAAGFNTTGATKKLHYPTPQTVNCESRHLGRDQTLEKLEMEVLKRKGAFDIPTKANSDKLVRVYFDSVHPAQPIFDRHVFTTLYEKHQMSLLILHTIYLMAVTFCSDELIHEVGFDSRQRAQWAFYSRAKSLYDADHEKDRMNVVRALFLMSFWWSGPLDEKDSWHWLGVCIGLAQSMGLHRSYVVLSWIYPPLHCADSSPVLHIRT